jgi:hypothetical protein
VAVPGASPRICSGAAYSGVRSRTPVAVSTRSDASSSASSSFAIPKSSSLGAPSGCTRMFDGLMSRCTTSRPCANCTISATRASSASRSRRPSAWRSQYVVIGSPSTSSSTMYGRPSPSAKKRVFSSGASGTRTSRRYASFTSPVVCSVSRARSRRR